MNFNLHRPSEEIASRELLFIGFSGDFDANIFNFPYDSEAYAYEIINNPFKAFRWLEGRVESIETYQPPFAILCKFQWLVNDDFRFLHQVAAHPDLCFIPFIALSDRGDIVSVPELLRHGADDCYSVPIEWDMLEERMEFLNQYKPKLLEQIHRLNPEDLPQQPIPFSKRAVDVLGATAAIALLSPVWVPVAIAVWLESGWPIIYKSKRAGNGYHVFDFLKFRSMHQDADARLKDFEHLNQYDESVFVKFSNDPRITRVGRFIRKYSLDELPQLLNILRGDMSLVGNRPLPLYEAEQLTKDEWAARFLAPAGLTGLWQVTKRGKSDMSAEARISLDIEYARTHSFWADIKILLKTVTAFIQKEDV